MEGKGEQRLNLLMHYQVHARHYIPLEHLLVVLVFRNHALWPLVLPAHAQWTQDPGSQKDLSTPSFLPFGYSSRRKASKVRKGRESVRDGPEYVKDTASTLRWVNANIVRTNAKTVSFDRSTYVPSSIAPGK